RDDSPQLSESGGVGQAVLVCGGLDGRTQGCAGQQEDWTVGVLAVPLRHRTGQPGQLDTVAAVGSGVAALAPPGVPQVHLSWTTFLISSRDMSSVRVRERRAMRVRVSTAKSVGSSVVMAWIA